MFNYSIVGVVTILFLTGCSTGIAKERYEESNAMDRYITRVHEQIVKSATKKTDEPHFATISFKRYITEAELANFVKLHSLDIRSASWNVSGAGGPSKLIGESIEQKILNLRRYVENRFSQSNYDSNYLKYLQTDGLTFGVITIAGVNAREVENLWDETPFIRLIELHQEENSFGGGITPETQ